MECYLQLRERHDLYRSETLDQMSEKLVAADRKADEEEKRRREADAKIEVLQTRVAQLSENAREDLAKARREVEQMEQALLTERIKASKAAAVAEELGTLKAKSMRLVEASRVQELQILLDETNHALEKAVEELRAAAAAAKQPSKPTLSSKADPQCATGNACCGVIERECESLQARLAAAEAKIALAEKREGSAEELARRLGRDLSEVKVSAVQKERELSARIQSAHEEKAALVLTLEEEVVRLRSAAEHSKR